MTGYFRDGYCQYENHGTHITCAIMTSNFLSFTKAQGNDLSTPRPEYNFPGLKPGDCWCLCAMRWKESLDHGVAPPIKLEATHEKMLEYVDLETLKKYAA